MKNTFRTMLVMLLTLAGSGAMAQFSGGLDLGFPMGDFGTGSNVGFGLSARYDAPIQDKLAWTATIGYSSFGIKNVDGHTSMIPIMGGVKYYFNEDNAGWYGGADIGFVPITVSVGSSSASETRFGFSPGVGYRMGQFDFAGRFNIISDFNVFGIRAAYVFNSK